MKNHFMKIATDCGKKEGATSDEMAQIFAKNMPTSKAGKCVFACLAETSGVVFYN